MKRSYGFLNGVNCNVGGATTRLKLCCDRGGYDDETEDDDREQAIISGAGSEGGATGGDPTSGKVELKNENGNGRPAIDPQKIQRAKRDDQTGARSQDLIGVNDT
ncbi:integral membrane protein [Aspergillus luchuensis]|uniref:Integral membrane protein n=1 Tax=Aspergillus kawachii TaxID=1069201 RepID=A0A146FZY2_ASPKA|nr:integral membrane protein [Aspergillus luchuensis]